MKSEVLTGSAVSLRNRSAGGSGFTFPTYRGEQRACETSKSTECSSGASRGQNIWVQAAFHLNKSPPDCVHLIIIHSVNHFLKRGERTRRSELPWRSEAISSECSAEQKKRPKQAPDICLLTYFRSWFVCLLLVSTSQIWGEHILKLRPLFQSSARATERSDAK